MRSLLAVAPTVGRSWRLTVSLERAPGNGVGQIGVSAHTRCGRCGEGLSFFPVSDDGACQRTWCHTADVLFPQAVGGRYPLHS